jgi:hypothetical protein
MLPHVSISYAVLPDSLIIHIACASQDSFPISRYIQYHTLPKHEGLGQEQCHHVKSHECSGSIPKTFH